ncbi:MAG: hypothetical protein WAW37_19060 [Syntrophobacteraceae bacterium]
MLHSSGIFKVKWGAVAVFCAAFSFVLIQSQADFGGMWNAFSAEGGSAGQFIKASEANAADKIFWGDGEQHPDNSKFFTGNIYYIDPATPSVIKTLATGADFMGNGKRTRLDEHAISVATVDKATGNMTNVRIGYLFYLKGGKIYRVDTSAATPVGIKLSSELKATPANICEMRALTDWMVPKDTTIVYTLKGTVSGQCWDGTQTTKAVKLNASTTTAPTKLTNRQPQAILMDSRYVVTEYSTSPTVPSQLKICTNNPAAPAITLNTASTCATSIGSFASWASVEHFDGSRVIGIADDGEGGYNMGSYKYTASTSQALLYTALAGEEVRQVKLDPDGNVYFMVTNGLTHSINKVPVGGGAVTTLATFTTATPAEDLWMDISPTHVVFPVPNTTNDGALVRSVSKTGGALKTLATASVMGGVVGSYYYYEDKDGQVNRIGVNNTGRITWKDALLLGASYGGKANWYFGFDTSTFRGIIEFGGELRSIQYSDNTFVGDPGLVLGKMPVNLSNPMPDLGNDNMIGVAHRRGVDFSYGTDIVFFNAATAGSLVRVTNKNSNTAKLVGRLLKN